MNKETLNNLKELGIFTFPIHKNKKNPNVPVGYMDKAFKGEALELPIQEDANFGVVATGDILVIDFDKNNLLDEFFSDREALYKSTVVVETGKGHHVYIHCPGGQNRKLFRGKDEIDLKGPGGYVVGPSSKYIPTPAEVEDGKYPSEKMNGFEYKLLSNPGKLMTIPWNDLVKNLEKNNFKVTKGKTVKEIAKEGVTEGSRNDSLFKYLSNLRGVQEFDDLELTEEAFRFNESKIDPPLSEDEVNVILSSVIGRIEPGKDLVKTKSGKKRRKRSENDDGEDEEKEIEVLRDKALEEIERMVMTTNGAQVYISVYEDGILQNFSTSAKKAVDWLISLDESVHPKSFYETVLLNISAKARNEKCNKQQVYTRVAQVDDAIWYDLGGDDWEAIKITPGKVETVKLEIDSPMFRRPNSVYEQVLPVYDPSRNALEEFAEFLKIQDKIVFKANLVMSFFEDVSTPMMILGGEAGSFKTTITSFIKRLIDPSGPTKDDNIFALQESHDDLIIFMDKRFVPAFDNVGMLKDDISDIFCRAVTGGANQKRQLYSDDDEVLFSYKRKIIMNGIDINPEQTDFLSRMITYPRNQEVKKISDKQLEKKFTELAPLVLGQIFHVISKVIGQKPQIEPKYRLTDFEEIGDLIAKELGVEDFQDIYIAKRAEVDNMGMENHPILLALDDLLTKNDNKQLKLPITETYNQLVQVHKESTPDNKLDDKFPKAARLLFGEIEKTRALQRALKISVTRTIEGQNKRYFIITRLSESTLS